jgi:hypothetical protein
LTQWRRPLRQFAQLRNGPGSATSSDNVDVQSKNVSLASDRRINALRIGIRKSNLMVTLLQLTAAIVWRPFSAIDDFGENTAGNTAGSELLPPGIYNRC